MGLLLPQAEWLARQLVQTGVRGAVLQVGRIDFFITQLELEDILVRVGAARKADAAIELIDPFAAQLYARTIQDGRHVNDRFNNERFTRKRIINGDLFFSAFGFETIESVDIDASRDNSTHAYDLNRPGMVESLGRQYDLVVDGGALEHVFDVRNALLNIADAVRIDGFVIQILPGNNTFDHGFYQFSPTLFKDWYEANSYRVCAIQVMELRSNPYSPPDTPFDERFDTHRFFDYDPWLMAKCSFGKLHDGVYFNMACAQKCAGSLRDVAPQQYLFSKNARYISPWKE